MIKSNLNEFKLLCGAVAATLPMTLQAQSLAIEEVIVTAQKRAESLQDVPVSVSALSSGDLEGLKMRDTGDIAAQIPNLQASGIAGDGMPIFSLRGVSMNDYSFNQNSPVAVYSDEVYKGNPSFLGVQMYDLERVEVLRGPQGTLYGKNSTGGAVNLIAQKPGPDHEAYITLGVGNHDLKKGEGALNLPLTDNLAVRVAGTWMDAEGWLDNKTPGVDDGNSIDEYGARLSVLWNATENLELLLRAASGKAEGVNFGIVAENISPLGVGAGVYGLYNSLGATTRSDSLRTGLDHWEFESEQDLRRLVESDSVSLTVNWDLSDELTLTSISSYDDGEALAPEDSDGTANALVNAYQSVEAEQFSQDLRITSNYDGPLNFIAGLFYAKEEVQSQTSLKYLQDLDLNVDGDLNAEDCSDPLFLALGMPDLVTPEGIALDATLGGFGMSLADLAGYGCQTNNSFDQERTSRAVYLDGHYHLDQSWTLRFGVRYTEDRTELTDYAAGYYGNDSVLVAPTIAIGKQEFTDNEITGKLGLDYTTEAGHLIYASVSHGYRTGAFNAQAFQDPSEVTQAEPETLDAFEVGFKMTVWDSRLQLNGAAFHYTYENQQFLNVDQNLIQTLINIDESEISGLELELVARPLESLMVRAGVGLIDAEVKEGILTGQDLAGNQLPQAPDLNFNFSADWDLLTNSTGTLTLHVDTSFTDKQYFEVANVGHTEADSYWVTNGKLSFESADSAWAFSLWGKNLFEEEYVTSVLDLQAFFGYDYTHVGAPRTFGADVTFRF
jgi:iron complex outermembrane receptor protein